MNHYTLSNVRLKNFGALVAVYDTKVECYIQNIVIVVNLSDGV
jgi:hypothetical protein